MNSNVKIYNNKRIYLEIEFCTAKSKITKDKEATELNENK